MIPRTETLWHTARAWARALSFERESGRRAQVRGPEAHHLLLLAWFFPPTFLGGVFRPLSLARYATESGWRVTVLSGPAPDEPSEAGRALAATLPAEVSVVPCPPEIRPSFRFSPRLNGGWPAAFAVTDVARQRLVASPPSVVLATGPPFCSFVAARAVSSFLAAPSVLDYRDEWTNGPFDFGNSGRRDRKWETRCSRDADLLLFTTESQLRLHLETMPGVSATSCRVVPNGWEPEDFPDAGPASRPTRDGFVISFVGRLGHTPPDRFLADLEAVLDDDESLRKKLVLRFIGSKARASAEALSRTRYASRIEDLGVVPKPRAIEQMQASDALLLMNPPDMERYLPGKLYDYLAAGPPVLVHGDRGEIGKLVSELGAGPVVPVGDPARLGQALRSLVSAPETWSRDRKPWLQRHTRQQMARQVLELLEPLSRQRIEGQR